MKRRILFVLGLVLIGLTASPAGAHDTSFNTTIQIEGLVGVTVNDYRYYGEVSSPKGKCVPGRTVKIISLTDEGPRLIDTDRTSRRGFFFGGGDFTPSGTSGTDGIRVKVLRRDVGRGDHDHVCKGHRDHQGIA